MWFLLISVIGLPFVMQFYYEQNKNRDDTFTTFDFIKRCVTLVCWFVFWIVLWLIGSLFAIIGCEIIFFSPFALYSYLMYHQRFVGGFTSILAKKTIDFIINNKSLYMEPIYNTQTKCDKNHDLMNLCRDRYNRLGVSKYCNSCNMEACKLDINNFRQWYECKENQCDFQVCQRCVQDCTWN